MKASREQKLYKETIEPIQNGTFKKLNAEAIFLRVFFSCVFFKEKMTIVKKEVKYFNRLYSPSVAKWNVKHCAWMPQGLHWHAKSQGTGTSHIGPSLAWQGITYLVMQAILTRHDQSVVGHFGGYSGW